MLSVEFGGEYKKYTAASPNPLSPYTSLSLSSIPSTPQHVSYILQHLQITGSTPTEVDPDCDVTQYGQYAPCCSGSIAKGKTLLLGYVSLVFFVSILTDVETGRRQHNRPNQTQ